MRVDTGGQHLREAGKSGRHRQARRCGLWERPRLQGKGTRSDYRFVTIIFPGKYCDASHIFLPRGVKFGVKSDPDSLVSPRCEAGVTHNVLAPRSFRWRLFAWKIGPLSSLLLLVVTSPLPPLPPSGSMKAAEHGFSPVTASAVWRCSEFWLTSSRTSSLISSARVGEREYAPAEYGEVYLPCLSRLVRESKSCPRAS